MRDPLYNPPNTWPKKPSVVSPRKIRGTQLTILGCGTSSGVPLLGCRCRICTSRDPRNFRTRASALFKTGDKTFLIDTSPDLRQQALDNKVLWVDAVLFTHPHADHIHGVDDLRAFNYLMAKSLPCYGNQWSIETVANRFDYIFKTTQIGGGKPMIALNLIKKRMKIQGVWVQPLPLIHGKMPVLGFRINDVAYITDCSYIPEKTLSLLRGLKALVLDCLRPQAHTTHLNVETAVALALRIGAKKTFFTHMGHEIEYGAFSRSLPRNMYPAHDGLIIKT